jgi:hypothetical protein
MVLLSEIFRREDFVGAAGFKKEAAAGDSGFWNCCGCSHRNLSTTKGAKVHEGNLYFETFV